MKAPALDPNKKVIYLSFREEEERFSVVDATITLNGRPAKAVGVWTDAATIFTMDDEPELSADFSWPSAIRIACTSRAFQA